MSAAPAPPPRPLVEARFAELVAQHGFDLQAEAVLRRLRRQHRLRPEQLMRWEQPWFVRLLSGGRMLGKNHAGRAAVCEALELGYRELALITKTHEDMENVMLDSPTGLLRLQPPYLPVRSGRTGNLLRWPHFGARAASPPSAPTARAA